MTGIPVGVVEAVLRRLGYRNKRINELVEEMRADTIQFKLLYDNPETLFYDLTVAPDPPPLSVEEAQQAQWDAEDRAGDRRVVFTGRPAVFESEQCTEATMWEGTSVRCQLRDGHFQLQLYDPHKVWIGGYVLMWPG